MIKLCYSVWRPTGPPEEVWLERERRIITFLRSAEDKEATAMKTLQVHLWG